MAVTSNLADSDRTNKRMLLRAVIASTVGTSIEWYDFFLYSTVPGLVFAKAFFPNSDPLVGTLQAFLIYAVGFIARPVGAAIFGHYGDRIGRKAALVAFDRDHFALVVTTQKQYHDSDPEQLTEKSVIFGIVTRIDLLNYIVTAEPKRNSNDQ